MSELVRQLTKYAGYHHDRRNIATHLVGIPAIVLAVETVTSRPVLAAAGLALTPAMGLCVAAAIFYLRLDLRFGLAMAALLALGAGLGLAIAGLPTGLWLAISLSLFIGGWALQFVGHRYEGRKPAFLDDVASLLIGPLFVLAEVAVRLGLRKDIRRAIDGRDV
jgi:uncharacterized membrane protein YGL010W